jgi:hypothetical protein
VPLDPTKAYTCIALPPKFAKYLKENNSRDTK